MFIWIQYYRICMSVHRLACTHICMHVYTCILFLYGCTYTSIIIELCELMCEYVLHFSLIKTIMLGESGSKSRSGGTCMSPVSWADTSAESFAVEFQGTRFSITVYRQLGGTSWAFSSREALYMYWHSILMNSASYSPGAYFTNKLRAVSSGTTIFVTICQWSRPE